jgi:hypothetical protein
MTGTGRRIIVAAATVGGLLVAASGSASAITLHTPGDKVQVVAPTAAEPGVINAILQVSSNYGQIPLLVTNP